MGPLRRGRTAALPGQLPALRDSASLGSSGADGLDQRAAAAGLITVTCGITVISFFGSTDNPLYVVLIGLGLALTLPLLVSGLKQRTTGLVLGLGFALAPIAIHLVHAALPFDLESATEWPLHYLAQSAVITLCLAAALLGEARFQRVMTVLAAVHLLVLGYGLWNWETTIAEDPFSDLEAARFGALEMHTAVWAEFGLGCAVAALFARNRLFQLICLTAAGLVIWSAEMRGAGVTLVISLLTYTYYQLRGATRARFVVGLGLVALLALTLFPRQVLGLLSSVLLLDDAHRGLGSGFSGRGENILDGLEMIALRPWFGVGPYDPVAGYVHSGFVRTAAQLGIPFALAVAGLILAAAVSAVRFGRGVDLAVLVALVLGTLTAPRLINLQVFPFLALLVVARCLLRADQAPGRPTQAAWSGKAIDGALWGLRRKRNFR